MGIEGTENLQGDDETPATVSDPPAPTENVPTVPEPPAEPEDIPDTPAVTETSDQPATEEFNAPAEDVEPVDERAALEDDVRAQDTAVRETRASLEHKYASEREQIESDYQNAVRDLTAARDADLKVNQENRQAELESSGLNPDGSHPQGRPQGSFAS